MKIGIDIGGSHIAIALVNEEGKIIEKNEMLQNGYELVTMSITGAAKAILVFKK